MARMHAMSELPGAASELPGVISKISGLFGGGGSTSPLFAGTQLDDGVPASTGPVSTSSLFRTSMNPLPALKTFN